MGRNIFRDSGFKNWDLSVDKNWKFRERFSAQFQTDKPTYQPGQMCNTCLQLQGKAGDAYRPCNIFAGKLVNANGWCKVWVKKA